MYRVDALQASSENIARRKIAKLCDHILKDEWILVGLADLSYRGDNVWTFVLVDKLPDKWYLLWWKNYNERCENRRDPYVW